MTIKILTFHRATNYGAVLQAYALTKKISQISGTHDVFLLDHRCDFIEKSYRSKLKGKNILIIVYRLFFRAPISYIKRIKFLKFVNSYIGISRSISNDDFFIVGSDQVWNYNLNAFDKAYFLDFVKDKKKKNAYSASFGFSELPKEKTEDYKVLLNDFNMVSVREKSAAKIFKELTERDVLVTLDPTLLLNKEEWESSFKARISKSGYILVYSFHLTESMITFINTLSKKTGLKVIVLFPERNSNNFFSLKNTSYKNYISPQKWISYFLGASYIITNSFHGMAFSINFNKQFFAEQLPPPAKVNSRIIDLLEKFNLTDRYIDKQNLDDIKTIEYANINALLETEREKSINYLKSMLENFNEQE